MSRPRYDWWSYVKAVVRRYPQMDAEYRALHSPSLSSGGEVHGSGGTSRTTEQTALRELPKNKQREYDAVRKAIETTKQCRNAQDRLKVIDLYLWKRSHTLEGAALMVPCSSRTAKQWHGDFIRLVAGNLGLLDE